MPLRVITFAVRGRTMYPPEVGLHAEDSILAAWETHAREALAQLRADGVVGENVLLQSRGSKIMRHSPVPVLVLPG
ncbi:conserved hypothetical protein [uncultured Mycobacterium sp.]|uniref:Uncharacterized protein n=1 Tax=uncultured Mycobacterium sp. TaxID=171292 RepID=A0A1Y5PEM5_9MYCO|nr:conserved hypothetical protein [uncultured Mycobacterium sp.]